MRTKPLLSICIPTYNRDKFLDEAIESVISQITDDIKEKVELCISDNASTDNTDKIIEKWKEKSPITIIYHKNKENLGFDKNFLKVVEIANGEYCWSLGSDDKIEPGGLKYVISKIESNNDIDIFLLTQNGYTYDFSQRIKFTHHPLLLLKEDKIFEDTIDVGNYCYHLGYISALCFKKENRLKVKECDKFIGSGYIHLCKLLSMVKAGSKVMYIRQPVVGWRNGNDSYVQQGDYYNRLKIDIVGYPSIAAYIFGKNSEEYKLIIENILKTYLNFRPIAGYSHKMSIRERLSSLYLMLEWDYHKIPRFWYSTFPFFFGPKPLYSLLKKMEKKFGSKYTSLNKK